MANEVGQSVNGFFESYHLAFEAFNAPAIADLFTYPLHITSDASEIYLTVVESSEEWIEQIEHLLELYRAIGFFTARILELAVTDLSPRMVQAILHWELLDQSGSSLYDFKAMYTLVLINDQLHIVTILHDEIPKVQARLARLKSKHE